MSIKKSWANHNFEKLAFQNNASIDLTWDGVKYTNQEVQHMWTGFKLFNNFVQSKSKNCKYVIGKQDGMKPIFGDRPHVHKDVKLAKLELLRLAEEDKGQLYVLYQSISGCVIKKDAAVADVSPQP